MNHKDVTVANTSELVDGEMKQVSADGQEILLARVNGSFHAVGAHCTHYGAPLVEGVLNGERVVCPWHHACFNVKHRILAVAGMNRDQEMAAIEELMRLDRMPHVAQLRNRSANFLELLQTAVSDNNTGLRDLVAGEAAVGATQQIQVG